MLGLPEQYSRQAFQVALFLAPIAFFFWMGKRVFTTQGKNAIAPQKANQKALTANHQSARWTVRQASKCHEIAFASQFDFLAQWWKAKVEKILTLILHDRTSGKSFLPIPTWGWIEQPVGMMGLEKKSPVLTSKYSRQLRLISMNFQRMKKIHSF